MPTRRTIAASAALASALTLASCAATTSGTRVADADADPPLIDDATNAPAGDAADDAALTDQMIASLRAIEAAAAAGAVPVSRDTPSSRALRAGSAQAQQSLDVASIGEAPPAEGEASTAGTEPAPDPTPVGSAAQPALASAPAVADPTESELVEALTARLVADAGTGSDTVRRAMTLALLHPSQGADADDQWIAALQGLGLSPGEEQTAIELGTLLRRIGTQRPDAAMQALAEAAQSFTANQPLRIPRVVLCSRVTGFGQYVPFPTQRFVAGRRNAVLVYTEVENFQQPESSLDAGAPGFKVALSQEVHLYHDPDGLLAWRQPAQTTRYEARTRVRDYFIVNRVDLPVSLTVGKYSLKVVLTDLNGGAVAESLIPVDIVADPALVAATP